MSKNAKFQLSLKVWSDISATTNDPQQQNFSWLEQLTGITFDKVFQSFYAIDTTATQAVQFPMATAKYIFLKSDQPLAVKYNGSAEELNRVKPTTAGVTDDGLLFQKMDITSLSLVNLSADTVANVLVFLGG